MAQRFSTRTFLTAVVAALVLSPGTAPVAGATVYVRDSTQRYKVEPTSLKFAYPALFPPFKVTKLRDWSNWRLILRGRCLD